MDRKKPLAAAIGIVTTVSLLLFAALWTPAAQAFSAGATIPQVFAGTVLTTAGSPAKGTEVKLYARTDKPGAATLIGTAMTSATGRWSFTAPPYAALPTVAQSAAAANMGYLNVEVVAISGSAAAVAVESAWVGTATNPRETGSSQPMAMRMRLGSYAMLAGTLAQCCGRNGCLASKTGTLGKSHSYTVVGEYHAYWNASGGLSYTRGASSEIGSYGSVSKGAFAFEGWDTFSTSESLTMGFPSNGPYDSHQMAVSMKYLKTSWALENADTGAVCRSWDQIDEAGIYNPGHGWVVFKKAANVINKDGPANYRWENAHHPGYVNKVDAMGGFSLDRGAALTYGFSAEAFGVKIEATTTHSTDVQQIYAAGSSKVRWHYVWGNDAPYTNNPQVVYSY